MKKTLDLCDRVSLALWTFNIYGPSSECNGRKRERNRRRGQRKR
jgi:hypothetical protein